jgi:hypothetical protein
MMENTLVDKTFRDSNGRIVLAQMPNLPLIAVSYTHLTLPTT